MRIFLSDPATGMNQSGEVVNSTSALHVAISSASGVSVVTMPAISVAGVSAVSVVNTVTVGNGVSAVSVVNSLSIASMPAVGGGVEYAEGEAAPSPTGSLVQYWNDSSSVATTVSPTNPMPTTATLSGGVSAVSVVNGISVVTMPAVGGGVEYAEGESAPAPTGSLIQYWNDSTSVATTVSPTNKLPVIGSVSAVNGLSVVTMPTVTVANGVSTVTVANGVSAVSVVNVVTVGNGVSAVSVLSLPTVTVANGVSTVSAVQGASGTQGWKFKLTDTTSASVATVKAASTSIDATDNPLAVALHPTTPLPAGTNALGTVTVANGVSTVTVANGVSAVSVVNGLSIVTMPAVGGGTEYAQGESAPSPTGAIIEYWNDSTSVATVVSPTNGLPVTGTVTVANGVSAVSAVNSLSVGVLPALNITSASAVSVVNAVTVANGISTVTVANGVSSVSVKNGAGADAVNIQDGGNTITVDGTVTVANGVSSISIVSGLVAQGASAASTIVANKSSVTSATIIPAPASGSLYICSIMCTNVSTADGTVTRAEFQDGASGSAIWAGAAAASGGGFSHTFMRPRKLTATTGLALALSVSAASIVNSIEYYNA